MDTFNTFRFIKYVESKQNAKMFDIGTTALKKITSCGIITVPKLNIDAIELIFEVYIITSQSRA